MTTITKTTNTTTTTASSGRHSSNYYRQYFYYIIKNCRPYWIDIRSLQLFRYCIGWYIVYDIYSRLSLRQYDIAWYTSSSSLLDTTNDNKNNSSTYTSTYSYLYQNDTRHKAPIHQIWFYRGSTYFQYTMFLITFVLVFIVYVGGYDCTKLFMLVTRRKKQQGFTVRKEEQEHESLILNCCNGLLKFIIFLLVVSYQNRNMFVHDGSDSFVRHLLFWICFLPVHDNYNKNNHNTIDSDKKRDNSSNNSTNKYSSTTSTVIVSQLSCFAILLQVVLMYLGTVCQRTIDRYECQFTTTSVLNWNIPIQIPIWTCVQSEWMLPQLSAVHYAMNGSFATKYNRLTKLIQSNPILSSNMTFQAMIMETFVPILCLVGIPYSKRHYTAFILCTLHFGLLITLQLPNWQYIGIITQLLWIPTNFWDTLSKQYPSMLQLFAPSWEKNNANVIVDATNSNNSNDNNLKEESYRQNQRTDDEDDDKCLYKSRVQMTTTTTTTKHGKRQQQQKSSSTTANSIIRIITGSNGVSKGIQLFFFVYMLYNWLSERNLYTMIDSGNIGEGIRLSQYWVMYSTLDHIAHNTFLTGKVIVSTNSTNMSSSTTRTTTRVPTGGTVTTRHIDLFHYIKTRKVVDTRYNTVVFSNSNTNKLLTIHNMSDQFPSPRWERAFATIQQEQDQQKNTIRMEYFGTTLCNIINNDQQFTTTTTTTSTTTATTNTSKYSNLVLQEIEIRFQHVLISPPNGGDTANSVARYNLNITVQPDDVYVVKCQQQNIVSDDIQEDSTEL